MAASGGRKTSSSNKKTTLATTKGTGKPMTAAQRKKAEALQQAQDSALFHEIGLIVLFAAMVLLFCCNFGIVGPVGNAVSGFLFGLFGLTAYVAPLLLFLAVAFWYANEGNPSAARKLVAGIVLFVMAGIVCGLAADESLAEGYDFRLLYESCRDNKAGGGILAGSIGFFLRNSLGTLGAVLVVILCSVICLILLTEKSLLHSLKKGGERMRELSMEDAERRRENAQRRREYAEQRREEAELRRQEAESRQQERRRERSESGSRQQGWREERSESGNRQQEWREERSGSGSRQQERRGERSDSLARQQEQRSQRITREEKRRLKAEERENEKILRMEKKVSGVMMDTTLPRPEETSRRDDMHEIILEEETDSAFPQEPSYSGNVTDEYLSGDDVRKVVMEETPYGDASHSEAAYRGTAGSGAYDETLRSDSADTEAVYSGPAYNATAGSVSVYNEPAGSGATDSGAADMEASDSLMMSETDDDSAFDQWDVSDVPIRIHKEGVDEIASPYSPEYEEAAEKKTAEIETTETDMPMQQASSGMPESAAVSRETVVPGDTIVSEETVVPGETVVSEGTIASGETVVRQRPVAGSVGAPSGQGTNASARPEAQNLAEANRKAVPPKEYMFPPISLLQKGAAITGESARELKETAMHLQQTLATFGVRVTITDISQGPSVTRYELQPEQGVKVSKIVGLADDIKLNLAAMDIRIEAPIPGKAAIGIEVPNKESIPVALRDLLETEDFRNFPSNLAFAVGKDIAGKVVVADIAKMPHMLIAGATGSGKSVCINTLIMGILYKAHPDDVKLIMVDPKVVELSVYNGIPHLLIPVVTDPKKASAALHWGVAEMEDRYRKFAEHNVRDLKGYNKKMESLREKASEEAEDAQNVYKKLPQIVIIVDELADLMMVCPGEVEESICRLAQLARAAGIHLIIATQRPSVDVITGLIKANMPSRVAFSVSSGTDSRTILDMVGAEKLLGKGDMLFYPQGYAKPARVQGAFVTDKEVSDVVDFMKNQALGNTYAAEIEEKIKNIGTSSGGSESGGSEVDELFEKAGRLIIEKDKASIGMLQRALQIGFNRAARIMDQLCNYGVVGEEEGTKPRKILMSPEQFEQLLEEV